MGIKSCSRDVLVFEINWCSVDMLCSVDKDMDVLGVELRCNIFDIIELFIVKYDRGDVYGDGVVINVRLEGIGVGNDNF